MITEKWLISQGFELLTYPDGLFYVLFAKDQDELFVQVSSDFSDISIYEFGWVENDLTEKQLKKAIKVVKQYLPETEYHDHPSLH